MTDTPRNEENESQEPEYNDQGTSPRPEDGNEATRPPSNPERDEAATDRSTEGLEQAGGGQ